MTDTALSELQRRFQQQVLGADSAMESQVVGDTRADAATRLRVYFDAYRLRLLEVLGNDYPALRRWLGEAAFERIGLRYIDAHPSDTPSVRWFGRHLEEFLRSAADLAQDPLPAELAAFEWSKAGVFDAPEAEPLALEAIAALDAAQWPAMRLLPQAAVQRLDLYLNVPEIFLAHEQRQPLPPAVALPEPAHWLLWRDAARDIRWRSLSAAEAAAWDASASGASFGAICELLCEFVDVEEAAMHAAGLLKRWVVDGLVAEVEVRDAGA